MHIDRNGLRPIVNMEGMRCFACGADNPVGLHMDFLTDGERVCSFVAVPPGMAGWGRTAHGGILSTMLDEIMCWAIIYLLGKMAVTQSMRVEFVKPVQVEQALTVIGAIGRVDGRRVTVNGEIRGPDDALCVRAEGIFAAMPAPTAVRTGVMSQSEMERFLPVLRQRET
ncbi:MAG: PaaI family thioesterase [Candidatus Accumulibacter sp.]|jgi:acyl-coenzyme A thioesterase PaaI-like protein|nr:PaaI family thioesterase [Accumulibacter sp.]